MPNWQRVYGRHPARSMPFDELSAALETERAAGNVNGVRDGDLELWTYTAACVYERRWSVASMIARGLILDRAARRVVATPMPKFYNLGEAPWALPTTGFDVTEKLDGSLGIVFYHGGRWRVATRGSFVSSQARWAEAWLRENCDLTGLNERATYLVEIVFAENRIVVRYDFSGCVLLAAYDESGDELRRGILDLVGQAANLRIVKRLEYAKLDDLLAVAKTLRLDTEGFVVRFAGGLRIKIKGDEYCRVHRLVSNCTPLAVWEMLVEGDQLERARVDLPEEFRTDFDAIVRVLTGRRDDLLAQLEAARLEVVDLDDRTLGLMIQSGQIEDRFGDLVSRLLFPYRKRGRDWFETTPKGRRSLLGDLRPTGNRLEGYAPSSAMNRFEQAETS